MAYLHSRQPAPGILHGDLKSKNLLLEMMYDGSHRLVITDFGLASWMHLQAQDHGGSLTVSIAPPEVCDGCGCHAAQRMVMPAALAPLAT
jgi:serine/threonine protein kinase